MSKQLKQNNMMDEEVVLPCWDTCILFFVFCNMTHIPDINMMERNVCVRSHDRSTRHKRVVHHGGRVTLRERSRDQQIDAKNMNDVYPSGAAATQTRKHRFMNCCACRMSNGIRVDIRWIYIPLFCGDIQICSTEY